MDSATLILSIGIESEEDLLIARMAVISRSPPRASFKSGSNK